MSNQQIVHRFVSLYFKLYARRIGVVYNGLLDIFEVMTIKRYAYTRHEMLVLIEEMETQLRTA